MKSSPYSLGTLTSTCRSPHAYVKYLNNIVEQSHRKVKRKMHQCLGWKSWEGAESTLADIELWSMIKQGQMDTTENITSWEQFYSLAA
nr:DDE-type integrase/transposase/recombinase [Shewanella psychropiezotolerans]